MTAKIVGRPTREAMRLAVCVLQDARAHFYQLLYHNNPRLAEPNGGAFSVTIDEYGRLTVISNRDESYDFDPMEKTDDQVLEICARIEQAIEATNGVVANRYCCGLAVKKGRSRTHCDLHGWREV